MHHQPVPEGPPVRARDITPTTPGERRNRPAQVSGWFLIGVVAALASFGTFLGWLYAPFFLTVAVVCSIGAIVAGHVGRARRYRAGRSQALACIVLAWLGLAVSALAVLVHLGVLVGFAALFG
ncbi:hypothetical protein [Sanguibacter sp. 25GB23B1]|uniref:hypothetical protein n=1 Tax=unclassified Sanguibacter TaxID=2645534 RepID=UPI0032AFA015